jgi:hypothetical protein
MEECGLEGGHMFVCPDCNEQTTRIITQNLNEHLAKAVEKPASNNPPCEGDLLKTTLRDKTMLIDDDVFFNLLQEEPKKVINGKATRYHFRPRGSDVQFKGVYTLAKQLVDLYEKREDIIEIPHQNRSQTIGKLCSFIYTSSRAGSEQRKNINEYMHPRVWENVREEKDDEKIFYICQQDDILAYAIKLWGVTDEAKKATVPSDFCRTIGCFLLPDIREELHVLQGGGRSMDVADDPKKRKDGIFENVSKYFNNPSYVIQHPNGWERCTHLNGWETIDPNDAERVAIARSGNDIKIIYDKLSNEYKKAMKKYTKGTGGGSGASENFEVWEERDHTKWFHGYTQHTTYLTWIHLCDKDSGYALYSKYEGLPVHCRMDGDTSSSSKQHTPRKTKETDLMETMIKSTNQMRNTIAESTNNLVKAVSGSSNDRTKTMIMEDLSKAHILYEKSLASLKKKRKRLVETGDKNELRNILRSEITSVKVHKGNLLSLENELQKLNKDEIVDFDLSDMDSE